MKFGPLGLASAAVLLAFFVAGVFPFVGYAAYVKLGWVGVKTAGIAAGVCWLPATAALLLTGWLGSSRQAVIGILVAGGVRFGLPLVAGITLQRTSKELAEAGVFGWIVFFYLLTLIVETTLSVLLECKKHQGDGKGIVTNG